MIGMQGVVRKHCGMVSHLEVRAHSHKALHMPLAVDIGFGHCSIVEGSGEEPSTRGSGKVGTLDRACLCFDPERLARQLLCWMVSKAAQKIEVRDTVLRRPLSRWSPSSDAVRYGWL